MTRAEWDATAQDLAKKASSARELLRLKKKEGGELRANAKVIPATPNTIQVQAHKAVDSPIDDVFGALGGKMDEAVPDVQSEVCPYIRKLLNVANDHEMIKGVSFDVPPDTNAL